MPSTINETDVEQHIAIKNLNLQIQSLKNKAAELEIDKAIGQHLPNLKLIAQRTQSRSETASTPGNQVKQNVMAIQELSGELSIENACSRLTPRKETTRAQP